MGFLDRFRKKRKQNNGQNSQKSSVSKNEIDLDAINKIIDESNTELYPNVDDINQKDFAKIFKRHMNKYEISLDNNIFFYLTQELMPRWRECTPEDSNFTLATLIFMLPNETCVPDMVVHYLNLAYHHQKPVDSSVFSWFKDYSKKLIIYTGKLDEQTIDDILNAKPDLSDVNLSSKQASMKMMYDEVINYYNLSNKDNLLNSKLDFVPISNVDINSNQQNFRYLSDLIHSGVNEIVLDSDIIIDEDELDFKDGILIDIDDLTIDGNGHTIDGNGKSAIFYIKANNIHLKNISFKNAHANEGAAIFNIDNSLKFTNCLFEGNISDYIGGAIFNLDGSLELNECRFDENSATEGGAIFSKGSINLNDCIFENNTSKKDGGSILIIDSMTLNDCSFEDNSAGGIGGAIKTALGSLKFYNCSFESNNAIEAGAIHNEASDLIIMDCEFENNKANNAGALENFNSTLKLENCVFDENNAKNDGGAFSNLRSNAEMKNCTFRYNIAEDLGGAIYAPIDSSLSLEDCVFEENSSCNSAGVLFSSGNGINKFKNCYFKLNTASNYGGVIVNTSSFLNFEKCYFNSNSAHNCGGAIYHIDENNQLNLKFCEFKENQSNGKVEMNLDEFESITKTEFEDGGNGGAIFSIGSLSLFNCIFENNKGLNGGSIYNEGLLNDKNSIFESNNAFDGGSIKNHGALNLEDSQFIKNKAKSAAGAVYLSKHIKYTTKERYGRNIKLTQCHFHDNNAKIGGAINNEHDLTMNECEFLNNCAEKGGAIINDLAGVINAIDCIFEKNTANEGGAMFLFSDESLKKTNCIFSNNLSKDVSDNDIYSFGFTII